MLLLDWSLSVFNMFCAFNVCQWKRNAIHKMKAKKWMGLQIWLDLTMSEREKQYPSTNCGEKHKINWYVCKSIYAWVSQYLKQNLPKCHPQKGKNKKRLQHAVILLAKERKKLCLNSFSSCICVWERKWVWERKDIISGNDFPPRKGKVEWDPLQIPLSQYDGWPLFIYLYHHHGRRHQYRHHYDHDHDNFLSYEFLASRAVDCGPFDYNLAEGDDGENIEIMKKTMIRVKKRLRMMRGSDQVDFRRFPFLIWFQNFFQSRFNCAEAEKGEAGECSSAPWGVRLSSSLSLSQLYQFSLKPFAFIIIITIVQ